MRFIGDPLGRSSTRRALPAHVDNLLTRQPRGADTLVNAGATREEPLQVGGTPGLVPHTSGFCGCGCTAKQAFRAQVFINVRPVNPIARSTHFPARSLFHGGVQEPGVPSERYDNCASACEVHSQGVLADVDVPHALSGIKRGSVHAISPTKGRGCLLLTGIPPEAPSGRSQGLCQRNWVQPELRRQIVTNRRGCGEVRSVHDCKNTCGTAPPSIWSARL
jgi:hypothetical protein